jgi:hypothetical protein
MNVTGGPCRHLSSDRSNLNAICLMVGRFAHEGSVVSSTAAFAEHSRCRARQRSEGSDHS